MTTTLNRAEVEATAWLAAFENALVAEDTATATELFVEDCFWRDLIAFTWNITTAEGKPAVADLLRATLAQTRPVKWRITDGETPSEAGGVTEAWIEFETAVGRGKGQLRLRDGKAWTLLTTLYELAGHEEPRGTNRPMGAEHGANRNRRSWLEQRERETEELGVSQQPYVLIVGGGQGGVALGARLRQLSVPTIIIDKHSRPGDQWRGRYKSLCLHDPVWYDHLPYLKFPENWPVFAPKDRIADWLDSYASIMELNYWTNTEAKSAAYDEATQEWRVTVEARQMVGVRYSIPSRFSDRTSRSPWTPSADRCPWRSVGPRVD